MAYGYQRTETIATGQVTGTLSDFPQLFARTENDFRTVGNGGHVQNANGYDLTLWADSAGAPGSLLDTETLVYVAATGQVAKFGRHASATVGTVAWWQYGDSGITTTQDNAGGVWAAYKAVYHFGDGSTLSWNDSSSSGFHGTPGTQVAAAGPGGLPGAMTFNSTDGGFDASTLAVNGGGGVNWSCSVWVRRAWVAAGVWVLTDRIFFDNGFSDYGGNAFTPTNKTAANWQDGDICAYSPGYLSGSAIAAPSATSGTWHQLHAAVSAGQIYFDGSAMSMRWANGSTGLSPISAPVTIGYVLDADLAELRFSASILSAAWCDADFKTTSAPTSFSTMGSEVPIGGGGPSGGPFPFYFDEQAGGMHSIGMGSL